MITRCRELKLRLTQPRGSDEARVHRAAHRADDELPAQRPAPGGAMKKLRILALMHDNLVPPGRRHRARRDRTPSGRWSSTSPTRCEHMGHEVHAARRRATTSASSARPSTTGSRTSSSTCWRTFHGHRRLRPERRQLPRAAARALHRLQSARPDAVARQGAVEDAARLSPHPGARSSRCSASAARCSGPSGCKFPLIVKSLTQEASIGISQASVVEDDEKLRERVQLHPPQASAPTPSSSATSRAASSTSASSAT